jgi:hypothetical protein
LEPIPPLMRQRLENALRAYEAALLQKLVQTYGQRTVTETFKANEPDVAQATIPLVRLQQILRDQATRRPAHALVRPAQSAFLRWGRTLVSRLQNRTMEILRRRRGGASAVAD